MRLDSYETELLEAVESAEAFEQVEEYEEALLEAKAAARNFMTKTKNVNIRIPEHDMLLLKRKSAELNIPYQTLISSLIHQFVTQRVRVLF
jgi:predicted DNA binding CopG/RHH family protein